ncbi:pimeloyl-[acyl-carrier protein] methyl ester esterase [Azomonas agilis]|uniref:Pimeloyl-[acyl-carrier protein] methyl ester esterase n=1 Tax=Azomonas agilis TaxID=116849 RepID=A0A562J2L1_9GAMM|nr:alpha/beta fold hydrolase [Azomonas agilis]TWH77499.1 pimeloyl-[acyl-carrier protein] methyl ester esterase [Azomonas agilis]
MNDCLVLLPGWGVAPAVLQPLVDSVRLRMPELEVRLVALPIDSGSEPEHWLDTLEAQIPHNTWLGGWSLGGMLATALAARRGSSCLGLFTFAANPRFVAHPDWPQAMPEETFSAFYQGCIQDSAATLKRFSLLCAQGCPGGRAISRQLAAYYQQQTADEYLSGLEVLAKLDNRSCLADIKAPQLHVLAAQDALVPAGAAQRIAGLTSKAEVHLMESAGHAALIEQPEVLAGFLTAFLRRTHP